MATVGLISATLSDVAKRLDPDGRVAKIVEILAESNPIIDDLKVVECNNTTIHRTTARATLPEVEFRMFNKGVGRSKSTTIQVEDGTAMAEVYAETDKDLVELNGNNQEFRLSEDRAFIEAMNQTMARTIMYGNQNAEPEKFTGFTPRFNKLSYDNVLDFGGTGVDNTSVWLIPWGENTCHGIYPKGSKAGLQYQDKGIQTVTDDKGGKFEAYVSHYQWKLGLSVRDSRYIKRIANIPMAGMENIIESGSVDPTTGTKLIRLMIAAVNRMPSTGGSYFPIWYMNKDVKTMLDIMAMEKTNVHLSIDMFEGKPVTRFLGYPIKQLDVLINNEEKVA